jgi:polyisoprenoid-binding protein YceI
MTDVVSNTRQYNGLEIPTAGTYVLDTNHLRVGFVARHLMVSKVRGSFGDATGEIVIADDPLKSTVSATIQAKSITTGVGQRDDHLRSGDFLEADKYPTLEFRGVNGLRAVEGNRFVVRGELTVKGTTLPVDLHVEFEGAGRSPWGQDVFGFAATTEIDREAFGMTWNQALETGGVMVGKKVQVEIEGEAIRQA